MNKTSFNTPVATLQCSGYNGFQTGHGSHKTKKDYDRRANKSKTRKEFQKFLDDALGR